MLIGRKKETTHLLEAIKSKEAEFIAITGRRRIGKTYLVRQVYKDNLAFEITGIQNATLQEQLSNFRFSIAQYFEDTVIEKPTNWQHAFEQLIDLLIINKQKTQILFFDEMPWLAGKNPQFLKGLSFFWNSWASKNKIVLIACGSATSWIVKQLILNKGGLHNRVTRQIILRPFSLSETKAYLQSQSIQLNNYQITQLYLTTGGVPYYLKLVRKGKSVSQIISALFFDIDAVLKNEFKNLYASLFLHSEKYISVVQACYQKWQGINSKELIAATKLKSGGTLTNMIEDLVMSGFLQEIYPINNKSKNKIYRLVDEFSIFYLKYLKAASQTDWQTVSKTPSVSSWQGFAFENLCFKHIDRIKDKLGVSGVNSRIYSYKEIGKDTNKGVQIDMIIERDDLIINLCEIKFYNKEFVITKQYKEELEHKIFKLQQVISRKQTIHLTLITTFGVKENKYSNMVQSEIVLDDLF